MQKIINEDDLRKATPEEKCRMFVAIILGKAIYTQDIKITHKEG